MKTQNSNHKKKFNSLKACLSLAQVSTRIIAKSFIVLLIITMSKITASAQLTSSPPVGSWSSTTLTYSGCTSSANTIKAKVTSISSNTVNFQIARVNGATFVSSGSTQVRTSTPCGSSLASGTYTSGTYTANLSCTFSLNPGSSITVILTTVSTSGGKCHSGTFIITKSSGTFSISPTSKSVVYSSGSFTETVTTSSSWTASSGAAWLTLSSYSGSGNSFPVIYHSQNTSTNSRSGSVTFYSLSTSKTVTVTQTGAPAITVSPTSLSFGSNGGSQTVAVYTYNTTATASVNNSSFSVSPTSLPSNSSIPLTVSVGTNQGPSRTATVTISGSGVTKTVSVSQSAGICPSNGQWFSQYCGTWALHSMGCSGMTIQNSGCAMVCLAMLHASENTSTTYVDPDVMNNYCMYNGGYNASCGLDWQKADNMDDMNGTETGLKYYASNYGTNDFNWLDTQLSACRKVVVKVPSSNPSGHRVLVWAKTGTNQTFSSYKIFNPGTCIPPNQAPQTLASYGVFYDQHSYSGNWATNLPYRFSESDDLALFDRMVTVYPNPVNNSENFNIEFNYFVPESKAKLQIFSSMGQLISDINIDANEGEVVSISTPNTPGIYIVRIQTKDGNSNISKLIVQ